jgi:cytidyltransferase-like protein
MRCGKTPETISINGKMPPPFKIATVGGTFQALHEGHKRYLVIALAVAERVHIWITSDEYARYTKPYDVLPYPERKARVEQFLRDTNVIHRTVVHELASVRTLAEFVTRSEVDVAVVEPRYLAPFQRLSDRCRAKRGAELAILVKPRTRLGEEELSSTALEKERKTDERLPNS